MNIAHSWNNFLASLDEIIGIFMTKIWSFFLLSTEQKKNVYSPIIMLDSVFYWLKQISIIWASAWDFQQFGMCDQQSLRSACAYAQSDQSLC